MKEYTERQNQIIEAAMKIIGRGGIQRLTVGRIAGDIGITEPAIYRHFNSKADILAGIMDKFDRETESLFDRLDKMEKSNMEKVEEFYNFHLNNFKNKPYMAAVLFAEDIFRDDKEIAQKVLGIMEKNQKNLLGMLKDAKKAGEIKESIDPNQAILMLMGPLRLLVKKWQLSDYNFDLVIRGEKLFKGIEELFKG